MVKIDALSGFAVWKYNGSAFIKLSLGGLRLLTGVK